MTASEPTESRDVLGQVARVGDRVAYFSTGRYPAIKERWVESFTKAGNFRLVNARGDFVGTVMATQIVVVKEQ